jgi:AcrR family transcriptional regulator
MIAAMVASCAEKTYAETTIADVVAVAHVSRTTFYREFADKRACFDAAVEAGIADLQRAAETALRPYLSPDESVRATIAAVLDLLARRPDLAQVLVGEAVAVEPAIVDRCRETVLPAIAGLWRVERAGHSDPVTAFGRAQLLIFERIAADEPERLPELLPELVYLATAPFAGHDAAAAGARAGGARSLEGAGAGGRR